MGRAKLPRKSTNIDMTAMCDVAFLLLSFFILATKQKPPEAVAVAPPSSVSSKAAPQESILITLNKDGKAFLMLGEDTRRADVLNDINTSRSLGLSASEIAKLAKKKVIGIPLSQIKSFASLDGDLPAERMPGIPINDTLNNELVYWLGSINMAYADMRRSEFEDLVLLKGDGDAKYPDFKNIKYALKKNNMFKFKIVTNSETVPAGTELYEANKAAKKGE